MDPQEDLLSRDVTLTVLIPGGQETTATVHASKPVMDVLVTLCAQHHLVPSDHIIKLVSTNQNHVSFKPNSMIGSLEFEKVILQAKGSDANKKKPHIPVATVRLLINYKKSHKAVVRVNPAVPLAELMPTVCEKCEFEPDATVLLRMYQSEEPLDLSKSLNDYGIRELYAKDMRGADEEQKTPVKEKNNSEKGNKGFFGLFKKNKKTSEQAETDSSPASPELNGQCTDRVNGLNGPADMSKKRRAPQPPMVLSQSVSCEPQTKDFSKLSETDPAGKQVPLSRISSTESSLKRTKRRAPPPPCYGSTPSHSDNKGEEAERKRRSSEKHRARIADHCPAIAKVMSELAESLQARRLRILTPENSSLSSNEPAESPPGLFSEPHTPEAELKALPGCQQLRKSSEREGLTTFTMVPRRHQRSFELPITLQTHNTLEAEQEPDYPEIHNTECVETEVFTNTSDESEHLAEADDLEEENQAWMDVKSGNDEEHQCIHTENIELQSLETLQRCIKLGHSGCVEREEIEERVVVETEVEKDWEEEYRERRRMFLRGHNDAMKKLDVWGRIQREITNTQDMDICSPPTPVYRDVDSGKNEENKELENQWENLHLNSNLKPKLAPYHTSPDDLTNIQPNSSHAKNNCSFTSEPQMSSLSKSHSSFDPCPPAEVSLFALAVFQKAKRFKPRFDPGCARRRELPAHTHSN